VTRRLGFRLTALLVGATAVIFATLGWSNVRLHRKHLESATLESAERISDVIKRSTSYYMLRNDREGLYHIIKTIAAEPGIVRIRIFNQEGRISLSTDATEVNSFVDKGAEACYACHARAQPLAHLDRPDRFRILRLASGERSLAVINPIENRPSCSEASCHAHPPDQKILGVLDTGLSLAAADRNLAEGSSEMRLQTLAALMVISVLSGLFVWRVVNRPVKRLEKATRALAGGELGYQIGVTSNDEMGDLAVSFNTMSRQLREAREESTAWAQSLEERVERKTLELRSAHEHVLHVEKMASIGKLSAIVAHEINNPLSGILTYAKLLGRWMDRSEWDARHQQEARSALRLIESESQRCGEIVKNLLVFARTAPMNLAWSDLNAVVERCVRLVRHQLDLNGVQWQLDLEESLPEVYCDPAQVEQVLLALVMNAIEAMPRGGNLVVSSRSNGAAGEAELTVKDDGPGIPADVLPHVFEPFFTTKEGGHGAGLGLAVSQGIVERHRGRIEVASDPLHGTVFKVALPVSGGVAGESTRTELAGAMPGR
jgi:two-component system NtrC family sensor kinase